MTPIARSLVNATDNSSTRFLPRVRRLFAADDTRVNTSAAVAAAARERAAGDWGSAYGPGGRRNTTTSVEPHGIGVSGAAAADGQRENPVSRRHLLALSAAGAASVGVAVGVGAVSAAPAAAATTTPAGSYNVTAYGALGNDSNDDAPAVKQAVAAAVAAGGGCVYLPAGTYRCLSQIVLPPDTAVDLVGDGMGVSTLHFPTDLGSGQAAVDFSSVTLTTDTVHVFRDISLLGPRLVDKLGQSPAQMDGIRLVTGIVLDRCYIAWFHSGCVVVGDHQSLYSCRIKNNYYGLYLAAGAPTYGNQTIVAGDLTGAKFAAIGIAAGAFLDASVLINVAFGFEPFCFFAEQGTRISTQLSGTLFANCGFESVGNALYYEQTPATSAINGCIWEPLAFTWNPAFRLSAWPRDAVFCCYSIDQCSITMSVDGGGMAPGDKAVFQLRGNTSSTTIEQAQYVLALLSGAELFDVSTSGSISGWKLVNAGWWSAAVKQVRGTASVSPAACLEQSNAGVQLACASSNNPPAGVALHAAAPGQWVAFAFAGEVNLSGSAMSTDTYLKKSATPGGVTSATGPSDGLIVGRCLGVQSNQTSCVARLSL
jgi:hypothetical protein